MYYLNHKDRTTSWTRPAPAEQGTRKQHGTTPLSGDILQLVMVFAQDSVKNWKDMMMVSREFRKCGGARVVTMSLLIWEAWGRKRRCAEPIIAP